MLHASQPLHIFQVCLSSNNGEVADVVVEPEAVICSYLSGNLAGWRIGWPIRGWVDLPGTMVPGRASLRRVIGLSTNGYLNTKCVNFGRNNGNGNACSIFVD